jgi:hypothetical protein
MLDSSEESVTSALKRARNAASATTYSRERSCAATGLGH